MIGPAEEPGRFANIMMDIGRAAEGGMGAVMGSKTSGRSRYGYSGIPWRIDAIDRLVKIIRCEPGG
jgi:hypothetical protein